MVTDTVEPYTLLVGKRPTNCCLLFEPGRVALRHDLGEWHEFAIGVEGMTHQRHEIREQSLTRAPHLVGLHCSVSIPQPVGVQLCGGRLMAWASSLISLKFRSFDP